MNCPTNLAILLGNVWPGHINADDPVPHRLPAMEPPERGDARPGPRSKRRHGCRVGDRRREARPEMSVRGLPLGPRPGHPRGHPSPTEGGLFDSHPRPRDDMSNAADREQSRCVDPKTAMAIGWFRRTARWDGARWPRTSRQSSTSAAAGHSPAQCAVVATPSAHLAGRPAAMAGRPGTRP